MRAANVEPATPDEADVPPLTPTDPPPLGASDFRKAIRQLGPRRFNVDRLVFRGILRSLMNSWPSPNGTASIVPDELEPDMGPGHSPGIRLRGVRRGSPFALLGAEEGDRVETINGFSVLAPSPCSLGAGLNSGTQMTVAIDRRGHEVRLEYELH
jgi:hypothetical protein